MAILLLLRTYFRSSGYFKLRQELDATQEIKILVGINSDNLKILDGDSLGTHMSRHSLALLYAARSRSGAVRALMSVEFGTMRHRSSGLAETLDGALKAFALGDRGCVDLVAYREDISLDLILHLVVSGILKAELSYESLVRNLCLVEVSLDRLGDVLLIHVSKTNLNRIVTVVCDCLYLCHNTGTSLKDSYRSQNAVLIEDLRHSDFRCQNSLFHKTPPVFYSGQNDEFLSLSAFCHSRKLPGNPRTAIYQNIVLKRIPLHLIGLANKEDESIA